MTRFLKNKLGLKGYLLISKRREFKKIRFFLYYKYSALFFSLLKKREKAAAYWIKAVPIYTKRTGLFFIHEQDSILKNLTVRLAKQFYLSASLIFQTRRENVLYLVSNIYSSGGHTRVVYDFLTQHNKQKYRFFFFSTELDEKNKSVNSKYYSLIKEQVTEAFVSEIPYVHLEQKMDELVRFIKKNEIGTVISFEHNNDLAAIMSLIKLHQKINIIYYHHQNLQLCVFPNVCNAFVEISSHLLPHYISRYRNVKFMELPVVLKKEIVPYHRPNNKTRFVIMTAIPMNKMFVNYSALFLDFVKSILIKTQNVEYLIVSNLTSKYLNLVNDYFKKAGLSERVIIKNHIIDLSSLYNEYDLYIDSLPIGGGKTILEMMELEKPCIIYEDKNSLFIQNDSLNYIKTRTKSELLTRIDALKNDPAYYKQYGATCRSIIQNNFDADKITKEIEALI